jgi:mono/diheme cytochrome c family protein
MPDGTMFHSITYGKNNMGSYASQLTREQRWQVIKYVRTLQGVTGSTAAKTDSTAAKTTAPADSTAKAK